MWGGWLKSRTEKLLIPFLFWAMLSFFLKPFAIWNIANVLRNFIEIICMPENGGLWFLWVLWIECVVLCCVKKIASNESKEVVLLMVLIVISVLVRLCGIFRMSFFAAETAMFYCTYFFGGRLFSIHSKKRDGWKHTPNKDVVVVMVSIWLFMIVFYRYGHNYPVNYTLFSDVINNLLGQIAAFYIIPIGGITILFLCIESMPNICVDFFARYGNYTMQIYILQTQVFFIILHRMTQYFVAEDAIKTIFILHLSIFISEIIGKSVFMDKLMFGCGRDFHSRGETKKENGV